MNFDIMRDNAPVIKSIDRNTNQTVYITNILSLTTSEVESKYQTLNATLFNLSSDEKRILQIEGKVSHAGINYIIKESKNNNDNTVDIFATLDVSGLNNLYFSKYEWVDPEEPNWQSDYQITRRPKTIINELIRIFKVRENGWTVNNSMSDIGHITTYYYNHKNFTDIIDDIRNDMGVILNVYNDQNRKHIEIYDLDYIGNDTTFDIPREYVKDKLERIDTFDYFNSIVLTGSNYTTSGLVKNDEEIAKRGPVYKFMKDDYYDNPFNLEREAQRLLKYYSKPYVEMSVSSVKIDDRLSVGDNVYIQGIGNYRITEIMRNHIDRSLDTLKVANRQLNMNDRVFNNKTVKKKVDKELEEYDKKLDELYQLLKESNLWHLKAGDSSIISPVFGIHMLEMPMGWFTNSVFVQNSLNVQGTIDARVVYSGRSRANEVEIGHVQGLENHSGLHFGKTDNEFDTNKTFTISPGVGGAKVTIHRGLKNKTGSDNQVDVPVYLEIKDDGLYIQQPGEDTFRKL